MFASSALAQPGVGAASYRRFDAPLCVDGFASFNHIRGEQISTYALPEFARYSFSDGVHIYQGVGELAAAVDSTQVDESIRIGREGARSWSPT